MTENDRKGKAAELRRYAKEQGELARAIRSGTVPPFFYKIERRRGEKVRVVVPRESLHPDEVQRQINEAARVAEQARREANAEAKALEDGE